MKVVIAAAGTGGHINPGIAIANKVKQEEPSSEIIFIGTDGGLETDLVPRAGYELKTIEAYGIERKLTLANMKRFYKTMKAIGEAKKILMEFKPDVVIGTGGYICIPVMIAANRLKIPTLLHESNAFPGVSVKLLSKKVNAVLVGFEDARQRLPKAKKVVVTGNPTKIKKIKYTSEQALKIKEEVGLKNNQKPTVLVFGGSQGAQSINTSLVNIIQERKNKEYQIIWAAGPSQYEDIKKKLENEKMDIENIQDVKILPYIYNMEEIMNVVDLVVCRSGAMTITEIANVGKPAIFIPFPYATENHQEYNAKVLEKYGAAKIILDKNLDEEILNQEIYDIVSNKEKINEMSKNASKAAVENVENRIYNEIQTAINIKK